MIPGSKALFVSNIEPRQFDFLRGRDGQEVLIVGDATPNPLLGTPRYSVQFADGFCCAVNADELERYEKPVGRKQPSDTKNTIEVWTYDVWGNEEDGYEVNDRSKIAEYETDLIELSDKDIKEIIEENFFHPETIDSDGNGDDQHVYLVLNDTDHSDYPLGEIYLDRG